MENINTNVSEEIKNDVVIDNAVETTAKEEKTFTQDELNKIVAERVAKERRKLDAEILKQQEMQERLIEEESEKLAKMTEAEKVKQKRRESVKNLRKKLQDTKLK